MISVLKRDVNDAYGIRHFLADEEKNIQEISLNSLSAGSTVFVIKTSQTFMLSNARQWVKITNAPAGGGGSGGGGVIDPTYDGGREPSAPPDYDGGQVPHQ